MKVTTTYLKETLTFFLCKHNQSLYKYFDMTKKYGLFTFVFIDLKSSTKMIKIDTCVFALLPWENLKYKVNLLVSAAYPGALFESARWQWT